jgi:hypothetical protein
MEIDQLIDQVSIQSPTLFLRIDHAFLGESCSVSGVEATN